MSDEMYFGSEPTEKIGSELKAKVDQFYNFMNQSGIFRRMWRSLQHYYGISPGSNAQTDLVRSGGKAGQLAMMKVNHFRNLGQNIIQLTTSSRPSPQPVAANSDAKSQQQVSLAKGILDYYNREKRIERFIREACELSVISGDSFIKTTWDGKDIDLKVISATEVIRDPNKTDYNELDWIITREWSDRFKVADTFAAVQPQETVEG
jgi:hypothetical protein